MRKAFEFFEVIAEELSVEESRVLTRKDLQLNAEQAPLLDELKDEMGSQTTEEAIQSAVQFLAAHFQSKGSQLPFTYDEPTGRFTATDTEFLKFVRDISGIRSLGKRSRDFEVSVLQRLRQRATGRLHRVGFPRDNKKRSEAFNEHLKDFGFNGQVLLGKEKDGGLDILWELPIGSVPHRPMVSVQCKNGEFDIAQADQSVGAGSRSLAQHRGLQANIHIPCVLFNDYIFPKIVVNKPLNFVPLGLSDLSNLEMPVSIEAI
ncbi:MAG: hypothetical protein WCD49_12385 [Candidatus Acidiferrales bacterium]